MLAVGATLSAAFSQLNQHKLAFLRILLIPMLVQLVVGLFAIEAPSISSDLISGVIAVLLNILILISWYRYVFGTSYERPWAHWRVGNILRVFWAMLKMSLLMLVPLVLGVLIWVFGYESQSHVVFLLASVVGLASIGWVIFVTIRLVLYLPAIALGETVSLRQAFAKTKPYAGSIFWVLFAAMAILLLASVVMAGIIFVAILASQGHIFVVLSCSIILQAVLTAYWLAVNAEIYRALIVEAVQ